MARPVLKFGRDPREALYEEIVGSLGLLPSMLREVFVRSHYQSKTTREIARELGIAESSVPSMLESANEIFYRQLHRFRA